MEPVQSQNWSGGQGKELQPVSVIKNFERLSCREVGRETVAVGSGQGGKGGFPFFSSDLDWLGLQI